MDPPEPSDDVRSVVVRERHETAERERESWEHLPDERETGDLVLAAIEVRDEVARAAAHNPIPWARHWTRSSR